MPKQFITAAYTPGGRAYTFHNDESHIIQPGDLVTITTPHGADLEVEVITATEDDSNPPPFLTKPCYLSQGG